MKIPEFKIRTDLALEEREGLKEAAEEVSGVSFKKWEGKRSAAQITEVKVLTWRQSFGKTDGKLSYTGSR